MTTYTSAHLYNLAKAINVSLHQDYGALASKAEAQ